MNMAYHITNESITILDIGSGATRTIRSGTKMFLRVRETLLKGDTAAAYNMIDTATAIAKTSDGEFVVRDGLVYFGDMVLNDVISKKLISVITNGAANCAPIKKYVQRILKNPSRQSATELYDFLGYRELPITPEGMVLGWKGVDEDYWSVQGNLRTKVIQGKVDKNGRILNTVGSVIEVQRVCVDDNRKNECSHGLHVGSWNYAKGWGKRLLLVEFDPADAVSVPTDCQFQKLRVCKYKVIADMTGKKEILAPVVNPAKIEREDTMTVNEAIRSAMGDMALDPVQDYDEFVRYIVNQADVTMDVAIDEVEAFIEAMKAVLPADIKTDESTWGDEIEARARKYLTRAGEWRTTRQIHSALREKGLTQGDLETLLDGMKGVRWVASSDGHLLWRV
jgi:hypothetical protein